MIIAPSILAADWAKLGEEVRAVEQAGASWIHCDVMDGQFVPPITFGPQFVAALRKLTALVLDVHLMIDHPETQIRAFADAGADIITVHLEACRHLHRVVQSIRECGKKPGVSLNPATPVTLLCDIVSDLDLVLLMTVNPGWGGQRFIDSSLRRIREARELISSCGAHALLEVDGGINQLTGPECLKAGADVLVAGTYIFASPDYRAAMQAISA